jgi:regulatory protein
VTSEQDDARRGRLRVARFGEAEPDQAERSAPVARFGDPPAGDPDNEPGGAVSHALLDRLGVQPPAPVAPLQRPSQANSETPLAAARVADLTTAVRGRLTRARPGAGDDVAAPSSGARSARQPSAGRAAPTGREGMISRAAGRRSPAADGDAEPTDPAAERGRRESAGRGAGRRSSRSGGQQELDPDADPVAVAREICLNLLTSRARTRQELAQALSRKGVPDDAAGSVLERFDEVGLIDDAAFAGQWVRSRHNNKGLARRAIAMELRRKGVDDEVAGEALAEVDSSSEEIRARELVDRKLRTVPADTPEQRKKAAPRLVGMLARKGYSGGIAYRVVKEALAAHGAEIDELGTDPLD